MADINLLDMSDENIVVGKYITDSGSIANNASNFYNEQYIAVEANTSYTLSMSTAISFCSFIEYNASKGFIKRTLFGASSPAITSQTLTTGANTSYLRIGSNIKYASITLADVKAITWQLVQTPIGTRFLDRTGLSYLWNKIKTYVNDHIVTPSFSIGTVTTGAAGSSASATITGTDASPVLNLTIPKGDAGADGATPSFSIGTVTTGAAGSSAAASITGTTAAPVLNLTIPKGDTGESSGTVTDVQVNGTSVLNAQGVANIPKAGSNPGVVSVLTTGAYGVKFYSSSSPYLVIASAPAWDIRTGTDMYKPVVASVAHAAAFYGLAKAAGDTTQSSASDNDFGTYTETAKSKIHGMLNAPVSVSGTTPTITALSGIQYVCSEVATLDITLPASGIVDVVFTSGSTPTVLTITPPSGVTVKWVNGFDPTSLEANTTYELNIKDGLGVAGAWS